MGYYYFLNCSDEEYMYYFYAFEAVAKDLGAGDFLQLLWMLPLSAFIGKQEKNGTKISLYLFVSLPAFHIIPSNCFGALILLI